MMDNLEICKRIAEIKGLMPQIVNGSVITTMGLFDLFDLSRTHRANKAARYVFDLSFDYEVCICHYTSTVFISSDYTDKPPKIQIPFEDGDKISVRKAILIAIIEVCKDNNND